MKKFNLPDCPYCRSEAGYFDSFLAKNNETHRCSNCGRVSKVRINTDIFRFFIVTQIISIIVFIFAVIMGGRYCLFGLITVILCSLAFYMVSPFMVIFLRSSCKSDNSGEQTEKSSEYRSGTDNDKEIYSN